MRDGHAEEVPKTKPSDTTHTTDTLKVDPKEEENQGLLCEDWYEIRSDNVCFTKSANSPSQTIYSDPDTTPCEYATLSPQAGLDRQEELKTVHQTKSSYTDVDNYGSIGLMSTPSISISAMESMYNPLNNDLVDLSTIVSDGLNDEFLGTARNAFYLDNQDEFAYARSDLYRLNRNKVSNFFKSIASRSLVEGTEDWGIDRSIYTIYSRPGFFADCHNADQLFHGEYLNHWGMEMFAECRMPLVFCIILTDKDVRKNEVQNSIVPLAISILDRYMSKNKGSISKLNRFIYSKLKSYGTDGINLLSNYKDKLDRRDTTYEEQPELNPGFLDPDSHEFKDPLLEKDRMVVNVEVIYNLVAAACYLIADRYNGLANLSVKMLIIHWTSTCKLFTKTRYAAYYIMKNKDTVVPALMSIMFDIYSTLDYVITIPFVSYMVQNLIVASNDIPYPQNPSQYNIYQGTGSVLARIALIDDTFHKFSASIITLSIYSLVRRVALYDKVIEGDKDTWLRVDESNLEIRDCVNLLIKTLSQFINTEILDSLTQPINVKNRNEDIFTFILQGEARGMDLDGIRRISKILSN